MNSVNCRFVNVLLLNILSILKKFRIAFTYTVKSVILMNCQYFSFYCNGKTPEDRKRPGRNWYKSEPKTELKWEKKCMSKYFFTSY